MDVVTDAATQIRAEWNYWAVLSALFAAAVLQAALLPCLCNRGTVKMQIAMAVDAMVLIRILIARIRRERGMGWVFYTILPFLIIPVIELSADLWSPH